MNIAGHGVPSEASVAGNQVAGTAAVAFGYGKLRPDQDRVSTSLQVVNLRIVARDVCQAVYKVWTLVCNMRAGKGSNSWMWGYVTERADTRLFQQAADYV